MEVEAIDDGIVGKILVPEGTKSVAVNSPIAILFVDGEDPTASIEKELLTDNSFTTNDDLTQVEEEFSSPTKKIP